MGEAVNEEGAGVSDLREPDGLAFVLSDMARDLLAQRSVQRTLERITANAGILMARHKLSEDDAFDILVDWSPNRNTKVGEVAEIVAATRELPQVR